MKQINQWLYSFGKNKKPLRRIVAFPYSGGSVMMFKRIAELLPDTEVIGVQLPGRGLRIAEEPSRNMQLMVTSIAKLIVELPPMPTYFYGHSLGATIAYDTALYLEERNQQLIEKLLVGANKSVTVSLNTSPISHLPDEEFVTEVQKYNGIPQELLSNREVLAIFLPSMKSDFNLMENYDYPGRQLNTEIIAIHGRNDPMVSEEQMKEWATVTTKRFSMYVLDADHFFLERQTEALVEVIERNFIKT